ncbi:MAG: glycosyltransferase, partial [Limisphaerales bacterium]
MFRNNLYFSLKPYLPDRMRTLLRKWYSHRVLGKSRADWPIDEAAGRRPADWPGWPGGKQFAFVLSHDVEGPEGLRKTMPLAAVEERLGFRSSFNFVPEGRYRVPAELREQLAARGFEVGIHDLRHDGKLYRSREAFRRNAERINHHLREWNVCGFRSAFMLHRLEWLHDLEIEYDASTFDTDPIEPQPDAASTIFPFWVQRPGPGMNASPTGTPPTDPPGAARTGYIELPYTLPQDSTLFLFLGQQDINVWKRKVEWIAERGGMVLLNLHPDYVSHAGEGTRVRKDYPVRLYEEFLEHMIGKYSGAYWHALPREVSRHARSAYPTGGPRRPRHACMVSYSFFEQDNRVQRYAKALAARGDTVDVLTLRPSSIPDTTATNGHPAPPSHFLPGIRVFHVQGRIRDEKKITDFATRMASFFYRSSRLLNLLRRIRQFDVIHVHNVPDFLVFAAWAARRRGSRVILDLHDLLPEFYSSKFKTRPGSPLFRLLLLCERWSCRFADHVIVSNHLWRDKVAERTGLAETCSAMVNHVDTQPYRQLSATREEAPSGSRPLIAAFPGGFYHHQGLHVAIEALARVRIRHPEVELHLVGDGPERERLEDLAGKLGLNAAVRIMPSIPISEVPAFLATADIGVVPKLADGFGNEAYSTKIMEFMAAGVPVLASSTKIDRFYFGSGEVKFFESGNPEDMARAWVELIETPSERATLVRKGFEYVDSHGWE